MRAAFEKYLQFDGTVHKKGGFQLHFDDKWAPLLTKLLPTEIVRTDDLTIGRSAMPGENGMVKVSNALRSRLRSNEHETEDRGYIERCFGRSIYSPDKLAPFVNHRWQPRWLPVQSCCSMRASLSGE